MKRAFAGVISRGKECFFRAVPDCESETTCDVVEERFLPAQPAVQQNLRIGTSFGSGEPQGLNQVVTVVKAHICDETNGPIW